MKIKKCIKCGDNKKINSFPKSKNKCKLCISQYQKKYNIENKDIISKNRKKYKEKNKNIIKNWRKKYNLQNQKSISTKQKKYQIVNKEKISNKSKVYYIANNVNINIRQKEYRKNNKEKIFDIKNKYRINNRNKINKNKNNYNKLKRKIDPIFKLRVNISTSIYKILKLNNTSKRKKSFQKYIEYSIDDLKNHIENLFESWMNWHNYGKYNCELWDDNDPKTWKWQLDHIIPHSEFKYKTMDCDEFRFCWALSNLRPYSAKQNVIDGATRIRHKESL